MAINQNAAAGQSMMNYFLIYANIIQLALSYAFMFERILNEDTTGLAPYFYRWKKLRLFGGKDFAHVCSLCINKLRKIAVLSTFMMFLPYLPH